MDISLLGKGLRRSRKRLGLTQEQLAELLDVSAHYIYELEQGLKLPSLPMLVSAAEILHVSIDSLMLPDNGGEGSDELVELLDGLSPRQRAALCPALRALLPYIRL